MQAKKLLGIEWGADGAAEDPPHAHLFGRGGSCRTRVDLWLWSWARCDAIGFPPWSPYALSFLGRQVCIVRAMRRPWDETRRGRTARVTSQERRADSDLPSRSTLDPGPATLSGRHQHVSANGSAGILLGRDRD
jgi:hypothetical protein